MNLKLSHSRYAALKTDISALVTDVDLLEKILGSIRLRCDYNETASTYNRVVYEKRKEKMRQEGKSMYSSYQRDYYTKNKEELNRKRVESWRIAKEQARTSEEVDGGTEPTVNEVIAASTSPKKRGPVPKVSQKKHKVCHCGRGCKSLHIESDMPESVVSDAAVNHETVSETEFNAVVEIEHVNKTIVPTVSV